VTQRFNENKENFIKYLTYALWVSILLYMVSFYVGYSTAIAFKKTLTWPYPFYGFSNIRLFQQYQLWGLGLICLPLLTFELKKKIQLWLFFCLACWWVLLFYAASRGVTLSWLLGIVVTAIVYRKQAWLFLRIQLISAAGGLAGYLVLFKVIPNWIASNANTGSVIVTSTIFRDTTYDRLDLWKVSYVMIKNFPFFGVGPMNFYFYNSFGTHPHNSVLQIAAEWGLPATFIILAILGYSFNCWYKKFNASKLQSASNLDSNLSIILFFTIIANGAYSLVEGVIVMPISQVLMFTMIGLMIGQYTYGELVLVKPSKFRFRPIFAGLVLVAMVLSTMPELVRGLTSYQRYYQPGERAFSMGPDTINPRIWMQQRRIEPDAQKQKENKDTN
jgi:O-antigen ligase